MASKSAGYCQFLESKGEGLLLLCEAQLGDPLYKCSQEDSDAASNCLNSVTPNQTLFNIYREALPLTGWGCRISI